MKKFWGAVLLCAILLICMGMTGTVPVDVDQSADTSKVTMYAEDGRTEQFDPSEVEAQKTVGWYEDIDEVLTTMWQEDGTSILVFKGDVPKYEEDGYTTNYNSIFTKMTNKSTGEEKDVLKKDVDEYIKNGWKRGTGNIDPDKPMICLTFDDGPNPTTTNKLLDALEEHDAHATFFMVGNVVKDAKGSKDTVNRMKEIGCELGSHTYDHSQLSKLGNDAIKKQIDDTNNIIKDLAGEGATVLRPPYGDYNDAVKKACRDANVPIVLWSIDTLDWKTKNADTSYRNVMDKVSDGDIILFHDIYGPSVEAAIKLIPALQDEGYQLVTFSEMADAKIGGWKAGEVYTDFYPSSVKKLTKSDSNDTNSPESTSKPNNSNKADSSKKSSSSSDNDND